MQTTVKIKEQVLVYGCGKIAETYINNNREKVFGVMDFYKTGQTFCDKRVLSLDEVKESGVKRIVIAARQASIPIIYRRISDFCSSNNIKICDIDYKIISLDSSNNELKFALDQGLSSIIKEKIQLAEVISFDVFDTLIGRRHLYSTDACEVFEGEKVMVYPRKEIIEYFSFAKENGKQVVFCSDMYLNSAQICELLNNFAVQVNTVDIFVSCEYGVEKTSGLFAILKEKVGSKKILHIGDSYEADFLAAIKYGIESIQVDTRLYVLEKSIHSSLLKYDNTLENRRVIGELLASDLSLVDFISPIIYKFVSWLKERSVNFDIILLSARDGWLINTIRTTFPKYDFPAMYFLVSRTAAVSSAIFSETDFSIVNEYPFSGTEQEFFEKRFAMDNICDVHSVIEHSAKKRENYMKYIESLNISANSKVGFMDLVSSGTCLKFLRKFLPYDMQGLYLSSIEDSSNHDANDLFLYSETANCNILKYYLLLEEVLSSSKSTLKCFDEAGNPINFAEKRTNEQLCDLRNLQKNIVEYGKRTVDIDFSNVDLGLCDMILGMASTEPHFIEDEFCGR